MHEELPRETCGSIVSHLEVVDVCGIVSLIGVSKGSDPVGDKHQCFLELLELHR